MSTSRTHALDIFVIGLGKAGGRLAGELARRGHPAMAVHTSRRAMEEQDHLPADRCCFLGASDGTTTTGGDPEIGRSLVKDQARRIESLARTHARDSDLVLVCAGLGGGTGSAVAQLVEALDRRNTKLIVLAVLPTDGEPVQRRKNALYAVQELTDADIDGLILVDGTKLATGASEVSILEFNAKVNERILAPLDVFDSLASREDLRAVRGLSSTQLLDVMTHGGLLSMGSTTIDALSADAVQDAINEVITDGEIALDGVDASATSAIQVVIEASKKMLMSTPMHLVEALRANLKSQSPGVHVDVAVYESGPGAEGVAVHAVASSASLPTRLHDMVEDVAHEANAVREKARRPPRLELGRLETELTQSDELERGPRAISDVAPKLRSQPAKEPASPSEPLSSDQPERAPNRAVYARLVTRYKSTSNDELQRAIARRLEQDRLSEDFRIRILAVDAMAHIGAHVFDGSLFAATEDSSPEVRSIAERALAHANPTRRAMS